MNSCTMCTQFAKCVFVHLFIKGIERTWIEHERLPQTTVNDLLTRYLDITTPPSPNFLRLLSLHAQDNTEREKLELLASVRLDLRYRSIKISYFLVHK